MTVPWLFSTAVRIDSEAALRAWERQHLSRWQRVLCDRGFHRWHRHAPWPPQVRPEQLRPEDTARWRQVIGDELAGEVDIRGC
jgi:hypothetical protein